MLGLMVLPDPSAPPSPTRAATQRAIGGASATAIVAGSMLGIGIYLAPAEMAAEITDPLALLAVWAVTGVIMLGGAMAFAELATRFPQAGGDYVYLREAFGPSAAFSAGWCLVAAVFAGSIAAVTVALCRFQLPLLLGLNLGAPIFAAPLIGSISGVQLVAIAVVFALTGLNVFGIRLSAAVQRLTTLLPAALLALFAIACLLLRATDSIPPGVPAASAAAPTLTTLVHAYLLAYFAYSGWNAVVYVAGEVRQPARNLPLALLGGTGAITALYVLLCAGFIAALGMGGLATSGEAGSATAAVLLGETGRWLMAALIAISLLSTINAAILGGARVAWAMAADGAFWRRARHLHPRHGTPTFALWLQAGWTILLILSGGFDELLRAVSVAMIATASLAVIAGRVLRRRGGEPAPFSPPAALSWLPALFVLASVIAIGQQIVEAWADPAGTAVPLIGLAVIVAAWLGHSWRRRLRSAS